MNCPYCGMEMKAGDFELDRYLYWVPENREPGFFSWSFSRRTIQVPHKGAWKSAYDTNKIKAYHCTGCQKFIFDGKLNE
jgi:hypothetical protein